MDMFCYQCQETAGGSGCCGAAGVCGKTAEVAALQDVLVYAVKGLAEVVVKGKVPPEEAPDLPREVLKSLFITITNANFDGEAVMRQTEKLIAAREALKAKLPPREWSHAAQFAGGSQQALLAVRKEAGVLSAADEDIRSLRETITYGLKGLAAYAQHAANLGKESPELYAFLYEALAATLDDSRTKEDLIALTLKTGEHGVQAMALLDEANTAAYGHPEITKVNLGVRGNPGILISGHDLSDLEQLLEQTQGTGVDVYTHCEMLPAHYYPAFQKYPHFVGNYGNAWWQQAAEFEAFGGPVLFTTNCIVPPRKDEVRRRIFTCGAAGYPGCTHIEAGPDGKKDFSPLIALAKTCPPPKELETGEIVGGFAHNQVMALADKVVEAVKSGAIRKFFVMAGCDGRQKSRGYYTEFAKSSQRIRLS